MAYYTYKQHKPQVIFYPAFSYRRFVSLNRRVRLIAISSQRTRQELRVGDSRLSPTRCSCSVLSELLTIRRVMGKIFVFSHNPSDSQQLGENTP